MTTPKKPTGAPTWISRGHRTENIDGGSYTTSSLSPGTRVALISALGFPSDSQDPNLLKCLGSVEYWLGFHAGGTEAIDNAPSAKVYVRELKKVKDAAQKLDTLLNSVGDGINPFTRDTLDVHFEKVGVTGAEGIADATFASMMIFAACNSALKEWEPKTRKETRGQKKAGSRNLVVSKLLVLYEQYRQPQADAKPDRFLCAALLEIDEEFKASDYGNGESALSKLIRRNRPGKDG